MEATKSRRACPVVLSVRRRAGCLLFSTTKGGNRTTPRGAPPGIVDDGRAYTNNKNVVASYNACVRVVFQQTDNEWKQCGDSVTSAKKSHKKENSLLKFLALVRTRNGRPVVVVLWYNGFFVRFVERSGTQRARQRRTFAQQRNGDDHCRHRRRPISDDDDDDDDGRRRSPNEIRPRNRRNRAVGYV